MKFTLNWLKSFLKTQASLNEISDILTNIGLEVESVEHRDSLNKLTIAKIIEAKPHADADKLQILKVDIGTGEMIQIVCGAKNAKEGLIGVLAPIDTYLPYIDITIKKSKIRGVESMGMMCSCEEIGVSPEFLASNNSGIIELDENAPIGLSFIEYCGIDTSPVIDIAITPNRGDCCSVYGIARDLAATNIGELIAINDEQTKGWPGRLEAIGINSYNNFATYLTLSYGIPVIALDKDVIEGEVILQKLEVDTSFIGEDGKNYVAPKQSLVLKDNKNIIAIAGITATEKAKCTNNTKNILLTIIQSHPELIAKTSTQMGIANHCSYRYERGIDKATIILPQIENHSCFYKEYETYRVKHIGIEPTKIINYLGNIISIEQCIAILKQLGFKILQQNEQILEIIVPSWRNDIELDVDVISEIMRIYGLQNIKPEILPYIKQVNVIKNNDRHKKIFNSSVYDSLKAKNIMAGCGFIELINWSFISEKQAMHFNGGCKELKLQNPIANNKSDMRPSLLPELLNAASHNVARGNKNLAFFEVSHIYKDSNSQMLNVAAIRKGEASFGVGDRNWRNKGNMVDIFDAKRDVIALLQGFNLDINKMSFENTMPNYYHPGRSAALKYANEILGYFGELHPDTLEFMNLDNPLCAFEVDLDKIVKYSNNKLHKYKERLHQTIYRDFAFIVDKHQPAIDIQKIALKQSKFIDTTKIFDVYIGENIGKDKKSLGLEISLTPDKNLTSEEIDEICQKIINEVKEKTNATLRF